MAKVTVYEAIQGLQRIVLSAKAQREKDEQKQGTWAHFAKGEGIRPALQLQLFRKAEGRTCYLIGVDRTSPKGQVMFHGDETNPTVANFYEDDLLAYCERVLKEAHERG